MSAAILLLGGTTAQAQNDQGALPNLRLSSASPGTLTISWDAPDPAPSDYRVIWAREDLGFLSYKNSNEANRGNEHPRGSARSITLTGLTGGEIFKVRARTRYTSGGNNNGPWSGPWTDTVAARVKNDPPVAPSGLTAGQVSHDSVTLTWTAPGSGSTVTGYRILRGTETGKLSVVAQDTGSADTEYTDSTVAAETTYHYAVLALSQDGDGAQSAVLSVTTPAAPKQTKDNRQSQRQTRQTAQTTITLVSNTGISTSGNRAPGTKDHAQSFDTGPVSGGYNLASIVLDFSSTPGSSTLTVTVRQDDSGSPSSTVLHTLTNPATYTTGLNEFSALPNATLAASTKYWVVVRYNTNSGGPGWKRVLLSDGVDSGAATGWEIDDAYKTRGRTSGVAWTVESGIRSLKLQVKGSAITTDTTAPAFESAAANGTSLVITFDEDLAAAASLANGAFTVKKTPSGGSEATVALSTTSAPVISGKTVTLTLATALVSTDGSVKVTYTKPSTGTANKLVDAAANETATFTDQSVTNNTPAAQVVSIEAVHPKASPYLADVEFRVTRAPVMATPLTVTLSIAQTANYLSDTAPTITIPADQTSAVGKYNSRYFGTTAGTVIATVVAGTGYAPATAPANAATVTFAAHPRPLTVSWASDTYTVTEGDTLSAALTLRTRDGAPKPRNTFTINLETERDTALASTVTVPNDYVHKSVRAVVEPAAWSADGMAFVATALVTVATVEDSVDEDDEQFSLRTSRTSGQAQHDRTCTAAHHFGIVDCRTFVTITDDDTRGVTLSAATLTVNEGSTGTYTVKLDSQPTASVTVTPSKTGSSDVTFAPASLTFLTSNWSATQTVTVTAAEDSDAADESATISHAVAGGDYGSVTAASVVVTVDDDETGGNNLPTSRSGTVTATEDTVFTFSGSNFAFSDGDSGDTLASVKITELPAAGKGTLALDGTAITSSALPKTVTKAELDASKLKYTPPANGYGTAYTSFKFKVNDGTADSAAAYTMTINVTNVNDPATGRPTLSGGTTVGSVLTASIGGISDPDGVPSSISYQWKRFASNGTTFEANIGTNSNRYTLTEGDAGKRLKVEVSFTDNGGTREGPLLSAATATVQRPSSGSLSVGGLGAYWHDNHDNGGNLLRVDSCSGVKRFRVIWAGPEGNRRADEWDAEITDRGGARTLSPSFRETPGSPGNFEMTGTVNFTGPGIVSVRVQGRFGSTWGTWSPTATLHCVEI